MFFSTHITSDLDKIADYITLIHNGEILFSTGKDELLDNYAVVKGDKKLLNNTVKESFVGIRENNFGFQGLLKDKSKVKNLFKDQVVVEKPTLEDIMLYCTRRDLDV